MSDDQAPQDWLNDIFAAAADIFALMAERAALIECVGEALRRACQKEFGSCWDNDVSWRLARVAIDAVDEYRKNAKHITRQVDEVSPPASPSAT